MKKNAVLSLLLLTLLLFSISLSAATVYRNLRDIDIDANLALGRKAVVRLDFMGKKPGGKLLFSDDQNKTVLLTYTRAQSFLVKRLKLVRKYTVTFRISRVSQGQTSVSANIHGELIDITR